MADEYCEPCERCGGVWEPDRLTMVHGAMVCPNCEDANDCEHECDVRVQGGVVTCCECGETMEQ